jgi:hypothetical protein
MKRERGEKFPPPKFYSRKALFNFLLVRLDCFKGLPLRECQAMICHPVSVQRGSVMWLGTITVVSRVSGGDLAVFQVCVHRIKTRFGVEHCRRIWRRFLCCHKCSSSLVVVFQLAAIRGFQDCEWIRRAQRGDYRLILGVWFRGNQMSPDPEFCACVCLGCVAADQ